MPTKRQRLTTGQAAAAGNSTGWRILAHLGSASKSLQVGGRNSRKADVLVQMNESFTTHLAPDNVMSRPDFQKHELAVQKIHAPWQVHQCAHINIEQVGAETARREAPMAFVTALAARGFRLGGFSRSGRRAAAATPTTNPPDPGAALQVRMASPDLGFDFRAISRRQRAIHGATVRSLARADWRDGKSTGSV